MQALLSRAILESNRVLDVTFESRYYNSRVNMMCVLWAGVILLFLLHDNMYCFTLSHFLAIQQISSFICHQRTQNGCYGTWRVRHDTGSDVMFPPSLPPSLPSPPSVPSLCHMHLDVSLRCPQCKLVPANTEQEVFLNLSLPYFEPTDRNC